MVIDRLATYPRVFGCAFVCNDRWCTLDLALLVMAQAEPAMGSAAFQRKQPGPGGHDALEPCTDNRLGRDALYRQGG
ncbi:MAG: hypothetical protein E4G99_02855 [Anaerolineales bacterium]|nr:MAG: hypothetical protein E4G99_02855 [Anaerolineales bacterium]